jgi:ABC-2 type transport system ATP-binding protein
MILEFRDVARSYTRGKPVLDGVSFAMEPGEVVGLLGRNGAGKTTLIRIAMGLLYPHRGSVRVFGLSPTEDPVEVKSRIGYVAEDQVLPVDSTIAELIALHRYLFPRWDGALEQQLLDRFSLWPSATVKSLSKGHARQVALLCAVCHRPELLLLDEPAGGLDPAARREFLETSIRLLNREGTAILFSSHYTSDIERISGRLILLDGGKVQLDNSLDSVREDMCVAFIPRSSAAYADKFLNARGCLHARLVDDAWHAVFQGNPEAVEHTLSGVLGSNGIRCARVPLEELCVELMGGNR